MTSTGEQIRSLLTEWTSAELSRDTAFLDRHLADDFVGVGPLGFMLSKAEWRSRHETGDLTYDAFDIDELQIRDHGDVAVVTGRHMAAGNYRGFPIPEAVRATVVLVHEPEAWQIAGIHMSFIAGTPGAPPIPGPPPSQERS